MVPCLCKPYFIPGALQPAQTDDMSVGSSVTLACHRGTFLGISGPWDIFLGKVKTVLALIWGMSGHCVWTSTCACGYMCTCVFMCVHTCEGVCVCMHTVYIGRCMPSVGYIWMWPMSSEAPPHPAIYIYILSVSSEDGAQGLTVVR